MAEKTAAGLVAWCKENLGMPYWYACFGQKPTAALLDQKIRQYPKMWTPARIAKARSEIGKFPRCFDCVNLIKGYIWARPDGSLKYNASQDVNANGMRLRSGAKPISTLPEIPGVLVFMTGHVGVYIGGGRVIECYGFKNVADRPLSAQKWTYWGRCPWVEYPATPAPDNPVQAPTEGLQIGDRVRVKQTGIPYYPGIANIPAWVGGQVYTVDSTHAVKGGRQCVRLKEINTFCAVENLEKA